MPYTNVPAERGIHIFRIRGVKRRKERTTIRLDIESYHRTYTQEGKFPELHTPRNLKVIVVADDSGSGSRRATKHRYGSWNDGRVKSFTVPNCILQQNEYCSTGSGTSLLQLTPTRTGYRQVTYAI